MADRLYDLGFLLVEAFAAMEVTAVIVANARIAEGLGLRQELSSTIITSYLVPLFAAMVATLALSGLVRRAVPPVPLFLCGLGVFAGGNLLCFAARGPLMFFGGRIVTGIGGALSFAGQLWTLSDYQRQRMTKTLVWGEVGAAVGVIAGPRVGALFAQGSGDAWRGFFLLNAFLGITTAVFAFLGLRRRAPWRGDEVRASLSADEGRSLTRAMMGWQVAVSILIVGAEYLFSDYLQEKAGKSPMFVGGMTVLASVGAVLGSVWAARRDERLEALPPFSTGGLLVALGALAVCLSMRAFLLVAAPIFFAGICMGVASVSIYASIVRASPQSRFLPRSILYLLGMQCGNALGVQAVGLAEMLRLGVLGTAGLLSALPLGIACAIMVAGAQRSRAPCAAAGGT
ncbi:MAG TPA: MFS transporter [Anaeromyxobacteraceae bacterium]|nr:MFS transporter [Anaeromyxobacteraceae bacterium]